MKRITLRVLVSGIDTPVLSVTTTHDVDQPIGTASMTLPAPRPAWVALGASVTIYAGYDGTTSRIFAGRIADDDAAFGDNGGTVRVEMEGHAVNLYYAQHTDLSVPGPISLRRLFIAFCNERDVPAYYADDTTAPDGSTVTFGGVAEVDGGAVIVQKDESPGTLLDRYARLYGYRMFELPNGVLRFMRVSGLPDETFIDADFEEGVNVLDVKQGRTLDGMANYIEVLGAKYKDALGAEIAIRSIPATVPSNPLLGPSGVNRKRISDGAILTVAAADDVRNVYEIDYSTPRYRWSWTTTGRADLFPGAIVSMTSPRVGSNTAMWLMRVSHSISERGWTTAMEGWSGAGTALPAGDDCVVYTLLGSEARHVGNEWLGHYRRPNPDGLEVSIPFTVDDDYTSLTIRAIAHGANSFSGNTQSTASRFEIWQPHDTEKAVASGEFPRQDENLEWYYPYGPTDTYWGAVTIPLSGTMKAGAATLKILSGYDSTVGDYDDYEVANVTLTTCGVGTPVIVT